MRYSPPTYSCELLFTIKHLQTDFGQFGKKYDAPLVISTKFLRANFKPHTYISISSNFNST